MYIKKNPKKRLISLRGKNTDYVSINIPSTIIII